ncbi:G2/mitotic-specific cyclin-B2-like [Leptinotarsa decemlineata]|uniref:G2/mitotic-specific cyclin-B2-like n=1 Tax=Leptinotarsa decemlineata TaxID=7539 RepID=UPI003D304F2F
MAMKQFLNGHARTASNHQRTALGEIGNMIQDVVPSDKCGYIVNPYTELKKNVNGTLPFKQTKKIPERLIQSVKNVPRREVGQENTNGEIHIERDDLNSYSSQHLDVIYPDSMDTEYTADIFKYLRNLETECSVKEGFLEGKDITSRMRTILINWIIEVHMQFELHIDTLHLSVSIVDRFLQEDETVTRENLQLLGITAIFISCKYEETDVLELKDLVYMCDNTFSGKQILEMEWKVLKKLDFKLGCPSSLRFLRSFNEIAGVQSEHHSLRKFILELALLEYKTCYMKPSLQAAAAHCLAVGILGGTIDLSQLWTPSLIHYTNYRFSEFENVVVSLAKILIRTNSCKFHATIRKKYAHQRYSRISYNPALCGPLVKQLATADAKEDI